jgi:hypothetical protein
MKVKKKIVSIKIKIVLHSSKEKLMHISQRKNLAMIWKETEIGKINQKLKFN